MPYSILVQSQTVHRSVAIENVYRHRENKRESRRELVKERDKER